MVSAPACIYAITMFCFAIVFLADWIRSRKQVKKYTKFGLIVASTIIGLDVIILIFMLFQDDFMLLPILIAEPIVFIRLFAFTILGMYYAAEKGYPSFPMLLKRFKIPSDKQPQVTISDDEELTTDDIDAAPALNQENEPATELAPAVDVFLPLSLKKFVLMAVGGAAISILYSAILFLITKPQMSDLVQDRFGISTANPGNAITIYAILALLEISIAEEIGFRLGIQNFLVRTFHLQNNKYWIAIIITSAIWTLGHAGVMDPQWVKYAQIFPIGLLLGYMNKKLGVESTIIVHVIMNLALMPLSGLLIGN